MQIFNNFVFNVNTRKCQASFFALFFFDSFTFVLQPISPMITQIKSAK